MSLQRFEFQWSRNKKNQGSTRTQNLFSYTSNYLTLTILDVGDNEDLEEPYPTTPVIFGPAWHWLTNANICSSPTLYLHHVRVVNNQPQWLGDSELLENNQLNAKNNGRFCTDPDEITTKATTKFTSSVRVLGAVIIEGHLIPVCLNRGAIHNGQAPDWGRGCKCASKIQL